MFRETVPVGKRGVFFLQEAAVWQQDAAQVTRARGRNHLAGKSLVGQQRQVAAVVEVCVGQHHCMDLVWRHRQRVPVAQAQLLVALEQPAVDQQALLAVGDQVLRPGHRVGTAQEVDVHRHGMPFLCQPPAGASVFS